MPLRNKRSRPKKSRDKSMEDIPMTPMIDVVFQLLIYFVVTFEVPDVWANLPVFRPAPGAPPPKETKVNSMRVGVYRGGYTLNDSAVTWDGMQRTFYRLAEIDPTQPIVVVATGNSLHEQLVKVLDLLYLAGLENISLISSD